jgi:serine/threonine protein kinase
MTSQGSEVPGDDDATLLGPASRAIPESRIGNDARDVHALAPGTRLGPFEIIGVHGQGGFAIVYQAQDHALQRRVALKEYMPSQLASRVGPLQVEARSERARETFDLALASFINEARLLARFDHPALVKVFQFWRANGTAYMAMPFYDGTTLRDHLRSTGRAPDEAWLMALLAPLTEALSVIHAERCYHRDIAPDNIILLAGSGKPVLLDFGAARRIIGEQTQALTVILKPGYAPVEQYAEANDLRQGPWTDVYALAAVVYYAITGKTPPASVARLMKDDHVPLALCAEGRYSERFVGAIDRALAVRPEDRTQSIDAFRAEIGLGAVDGLASTETSATTRMHGRSDTEARGPTKGTPGPAWRKATILAGASLLLLIGFAVYIVLGRNGPSTSKPPDHMAATVSAHAASPVGRATSAAPAVEPEKSAAAVGNPPAVPAQTAYSLPEELDRIVRGSTPGFVVDAAPAKPRFKVGRDALAFQVKSEREGLVYVLLYASDGSLVLLFPNSQSTQNRIQAGQTLELPQASWPMKTAEPVGQQRFIVLVSRWPRDFSRIGQGRDLWFLKLPTRETGVSSASGQGSPLAGVAECEGNGCDVYGAAAFDVEVVH